MTNFIRVLIAISFLALTITGCEKKEEAPKETEEKTTEEEAAADKAAEEEAAEEEAAAKEAAAEEEGGQWVESELYEVKFRVPEDWNVVKDEESITVNAPEGSTTIILVGSESENVIQTALRDVKDEVQMKELEVGRSSMTVINGMAGYRGDGSAVLVTDAGDQEIQFLAYSLKAGEKAVTMMIFSEAEMYEARKEEIQGIAQTIQRIP